MARQHSESAEADRTVLLGEQLVRIHDLLRGQLAELRRDLAAAKPSGPPVLEDELRRKCLSFCLFLHGHHTAEDDHMLPGLAASHPALAPVLERLTREHAVISDRLDRIQELADKGDPVSVRADVERLAAEVEAHLDWEEAQIVDALDSYGPTVIPAGGPDRD
ncbi:hemerythrin domain-containing protein [Nocardiopsis sp. NPDC050513]|uniref:hemerythrin domain-containing protein n=1 Tax=Nocardiopsis sp. NPDC050513 TaxID=3364338 RepID=UPI0037A5EE0A